MTGFVTEALRRDHRRDEFTCGVDALDRYLREFALQDMKRLIAGCFVAVRDDAEISGYYTLAAMHIPLDTLPAETTKKLPRYPAIPAILIGRLAVASKLRGQGLGRALLADAAIRTRSFGIGAYALVVDAKDDAAVRFYRANGFAPIPDEPKRLFLPLATALKLIG